MQGTITDDTSAVNAINDVLAEKVGPQKYRIWFKKAWILILFLGICLFFAIESDIF